MLKPKPLTALLLAVLTFVLPPSVLAQGVIFLDNMEEPVPEPLFPVDAGGSPALPDGATTRALNWFLAQTVPGVVPSDQDIQDNFTDNFIASQSINGLRDFLLSVQTNYPNARVTDLIGISPLQFNGLITGSNGNEAFVVLGASFTTDKISQLSVSFFGTGGGGVITVDDLNLTLEQAADKFMTLSTEAGLLLARVNRQTNQCEPVLERDAATLRATASVFKIFSLGAVADAIQDRTITTDQLIPRVDEERTPGGPLINEPDGTLLTVDELATLMLSLSDNTATDLLHELVGRERLNRLVGELGHSTPDAITPFLKTGEQFHLLNTFSLVQAESYQNGTEQFQADFVVNQIEPLGNFVDNRGNVNNTSVYTTVTWRASPRDVCQALAAHRVWPRGSDQARQVDRALGAQAAQPNVREAWDRVWYKGGGLSISATTQVVLTHAWLLENGGEDPWVLVALSNNPGANIDQFAVQSVLGRLLQLAANL
ncbi:MAG: serine hydrolase [Pseudomonadota bacterium]